MSFKSYKPPCLVDLKVECVKQQPLHHGDRQMCDLYVKVKQDEGWRCGEDGAVNGIVVVSPSLSIKHLRRQAAPERHFQFRRLVYPFIGPFKMLRFVLSLTKVKHRRWFMFDLWLNAYQSETGPTDVIFFLLFWGLTSHKWRSYGGELEISSSRPSLRVVSVTWTINEEPTSILMCSKLQHLCIRKFS